MKRLLAVLLLAAQGARAAEEGVSAAAPSLEDGETLEAPAGPTSRPGFSGDLRLRMGDARPRSSSFEEAPEGLRHGPYASQRLRVRWGDRLEAGSLSLRPAPGPAFSAAGLRRAGTVKGYVSVPGAFLLGDYDLSFGQGLVFYDGLSEFVRPAWAQGRGFSPDLSAGRGEGLRGAVLRAGAGGWSALGFASRQGLDAPRGPDGKSAADLWSLREGSSSDPDDRGSLREEAAGGRLEGRWGESGASRAAVTAAFFRYAPGVAPPARGFSDGGIFRGERNAVLGADAALSWEGGRAALDAARSAGGGLRGTAAAATLFQGAGRSGAWATVFSYGRGYFSRLGKGPAFEVVDLPGALPVNQRGLSMGAREEGPWGHLEGEAAWAFFPSPQGNGRNGDPVFASQGRRWGVEGEWVVSPGWKGVLRLQERARDRSLSPPDGAGRVQGEEAVRKLRAETVWQAAPGVRLRTRCDVRWERAPVAAQRAEGRLLMGEVGWGPSPAWSVTARVYAFQSPEAYLTSGVEEVWSGVVSPLLPAGTGNFRGAAGERYALSLRRRWPGGFRTWAEYAETTRWRGAVAQDIRRTWRFQGDFSW